MSKMERYKLGFPLIFFLILPFFLFSQCDAGKDSDENASFTFPEIDNIDSHVYQEIKITCETYWDLSRMIDSTFEIVKDGDEYAIHCEGNIDGELYQFVIRVDKEGKWVNDGRSLKE